MTFYRFSFRTVAATHNSSLHYGTDSPYSLLQSVDKLLIH